MVLKNLLSIQVQRGDVGERVPVPEGGALLALPRGRREDLLRGVEAESRPRGQVRIRTQMQLL